MSNSNTTWQLVQSVTERLTAHGHTPFKLEDLVAGVQRIDPSRGRGTITPVVQGMTLNAGLGPAQPCGHTLYRVDRGMYRLRKPGDKARSQATSIAAKQHQTAVRMRVITRDELQRRLETLAGSFADCVAAYDATPPFTRTNQYEAHRSTIDQRRALGSVAVAIRDRQFIDELRRTLGAWGLNQRASQLTDRAAFVRRLRTLEPRLAALEGRHLERLSAGEVGTIASELAYLVEHLDVVTNVAKLVAGTKTLHHLLPDLVPPMDRAWTGTFFGWSIIDLQRNEAVVFRETFAMFAELARHAIPSRFVSEHSSKQDWKTSATKVLDNAVIGYCKLNSLGPTSAAVADAAQQA